MNISNIVSARKASQEAMETAAQTRAEATNGDQQAVRKLAQTQTVNSPQATPATAGAVVAEAAVSANGKLNATA